jgi:alkanesulfonate monooxygenase SsuD/methylene tetrahydromethanopterin reductase-like flavin-dependent oxidoreductase (luciferase family)
MIMGAGVGWMKPEFEALGVDRRMRGQASNETLRVIRHLFAHDEGYSGDLVNFPAFVFAPRPRCPPIWIGGNGEAAMARVAEFGDGWHPMLAADKLKPAVESLNARLAAKSRTPVEIVVRRGMRMDDIEAARARLEAEREAGATYFILDLGRYPDENDFAAKAEKFMAKIAP